MIRAIVTGAAGFIGSAVVKSLARKHICVAAIDITDCASQFADLETVETFTADLNSSISSTVKAKNPQG